MPRDDDRRAEAMGTIRLSDHELIGLAGLANQATLWSTSGGDYPSYEATEEQRKEYEAKEEERRLEEAKRRAVAMLELRTWIEAREADAYLTWR